MSAHSDKYRVPSPILVKTVRTLAYVISRILWRVEFHNTENIPAPGTGGFIIASNHPTYFDPFWISLPFKTELRYLTWDLAIEFPLAGTLLARLGAIPTSLGPGGTIGTLKQCLRILREGFGLVVFPEGGRESSDGLFLPFKTGVAQMAMRTGVPVLPVTIVGGSKVWPRGRNIPRPGKIKVYFHRAIHISKPEKGSDEQAYTIEQTARLRDIIASVPVV